MEDKILDIYFDERYGKLYESIENGKAFVFKAKTEDGEIHNQFIKRKIPIDLGDSNEYYDIVTPYGYGGPIIVKCTGDKERLLNEYNEKFKEYCKENNIVSEFVRFHPILNNAMDFKEIYNPEHIRNTLGTNLKLYENPFNDEFSKGCRKNIKQALNKGITYRVTEKPSDLSTFMKIYYSTMKRNKATDYYYFPETYFQDILKNFQDNTILVEAIYNDTVIASGLYFLYNKIIHIHLSGTLEEYLYLSPAYVLRYAIMLWGKENNYETIHHGGGRSNSQEDSLYKFKKQFAKNTEYEFYIGKKIWNQDIYDKMCQKKQVDKNADFFPAYR